MVVVHIVGLSLIILVLIVLVRLMFGYTAGGRRRP
jgi:hypothetical protein